MRDPERLPLRRLIGFWLPLALMWLIMGIEQPAMSAVVTRLPNPERSLAGFEIAFGIAALIHGPILQMLSAATAIVRGRQSYAALLRVLRWLVVSLTALHLVLATPVVFRFLVAGILQIPVPLVPVANTVFAILVPLTAVVGYRRFYQGALIQAGRTRVVSITMIVRLSATVAVLGLGLLAARIGVSWAPPGYVVAAVAFLAGLIAGMLVARSAFVRDLLPGLPEEEEERWSTQGILRFYLPLALTSLIIMVSRPLTAFAIARAESPVASLAAWPLVQNFLFLFSAIGLSFQEVVVARARSGGIKENREIFTLAGIISGALVTIFVGAWASGLTTVWYESVMSAPQTLLPLVASTTVLLIPIPLLAVLLSSVNGFLVARRATVFVTVATAANVTIQLILALTLPTTTELTGTDVASIIKVAAMTTQIAVLAIGIRFSYARPGSEGRRVGTHRTPTRANSAR